MRKRNQNESKEKKWKVGPIGSETSNDTRIVDLAECFINCGGY